MRNLLVFLLAASGLAFGQGVIGNGLVQYTYSAPSGACGQNSQAQVVVGPGQIWTCQNGTWTQIGSASLPGTVVQTNQANTFTTGAQDFTGATSILVATQTVGDNSTKAASTAFVTAAFANAVVNNAVNTGTAAMTLDMAASTVADALEVPSQPGLVSDGLASIGYDTTNKNFHIPMNNADALSAGEASAITLNVLLKSCSSTYAGLCATSLADNATIISTAEPFKLTEGSASGAGGGADTFHADSTQHAFEVNNNNTGEMPVSRVACVNVTPVTVNASVTTDQLLQACSFNNSLLNVIGRTIRIWSAGIYSTAATSTAQITLKVKLCTVSGCASGTVISLDSIQTIALASVTVTNNAWNVAGYATTQTTGALSAYESHGILSIDLGSLTTAADSIFNDVNTTTVGTIDNTVPLFLQITGAYSAASTSNSMTGRQLIVEILD